METIDSTDIANINERVRAWSAGGEPMQPVLIDRIIIAEDALDALVDEVRGVSGGGRVLVVEDHTPMRRGADDLKSLINQALSRRCVVETRTLPEQPARAFHAEIEAGQKLAGELAASGADFAAVVSVGSGSITDVCKYARHLHAETTGREVPLVCVPTAASVTAYTSAMAALTIAGVKRSVPTLAPDVVVCDLRTLADAPRAMTQAGFGDVLARSVSYGDWYLAHQLGMDRCFSLVPGQLLEHAEHNMLRCAAGIAAGQTEAVRALLDALLLSGMAMSIARQTAPLSGWEHAISHFLDLTADPDRREPALHGAQVGIGTLISARGYETAWTALDLDQLTREHDDDHYRSLLESVCRRYDASDALVAELWRDFAKKLGTWRAARDARRRFGERKRAGEFDSFIERAVRRSAAIDHALREVGAPWRFADLDQPVGAGSARSAVRFAHLVRARFTLGDLLSESAWLDDAATEALLAGLL